MRKYLILLTAYCLLLTVHCNAQGWAWSAQGTSTSDDNVSNICVDKNGDAYIVGDFGTYMSTSVGQGYIRGANYAYFGTDSVYNNGVNQIFLIKYNGSSGAVIWAKSIGANNGYDHSAPCDDCEKGYNITYDSVSNSIYMTGIWYGFANFGSTLLNGAGDMFLSKLDLNGNFLWTKVINSRGGNYISNSNLITDKRNGAIYLAGSGKDTMTFGGTKIPKGGYIAKYDTAGNCVWAKGQKNAEFTRLLIFKNDIIGIGNNNTNNDTITIGAYTCTLSTSNPDQTVFLARMDSSTNVKWIKLLPSGSFAGGSGLISDLSNFYITGNFQSSITIGPNTFTNTSSNVDMFLAKYDTAGNMKWAKQANASFSVLPYGMVNDFTGNFYVGGDMGGTMTLGSTSYTQAPFIQGFLSRFDTSGACLGIIGTGGRIAEDNAGNVFVTKNFQYHTTIGGTTYTATVTNPATSDLFVAKHGPITVDIQSRKANNTNNQLVIYANPTAGKCNISIPDDFLHESNLTLQIFDVNGKMLQNTKVVTTDDKIKLNIEAEAKGTYNAVLSNGKKSYTGKIIFE